MNRLAKASAEDAGLLERGAAAPSGSPHAEIGLREVKVIKLEADCFALSLVWHTRCCWMLDSLVAFVMPLGSAFVQFFVLYFLAMQHGNRFDQGVWLEPWSGNISVTFMKLVTLVLINCKISTEMGHAKELCYALFAGDLARTSSWCCGAWALVLQYCMSISVLGAAISVVLACQTAIDAALRIFSIFIVIDIDNQVGKYLQQFMALDTTVPVKPHFVELERETRRRHGSCCMTFWFLIVPTVVSLSVVIACTSWRCIPLTVLKHGLVSNRAAPEMLVGRADGCCPPYRSESRAQDGDASYTTLLLGALREHHQTLHSVTPVVYWVVVPSSHSMPTSLQILEGRDAGNNPALQAGVLNASAVQAKAWLEDQGYPPSTYLALRDEEQLGLRSLPYVASFTIGGPALADIWAYRVYVAAQNPQTLALSPVPAASEIYRAKGCARGCQKCVQAGVGNCDPDSCVPGWFESYGHCRECLPNCGRCLFAAACEVCNEGYSLDSKGTCQPCNVPHCRQCSSINVSRCETLQCEEGFDSADDGSCRPCRDRRCTSCGEDGRCFECSQGYGLENGTCAACAHGCKDCTWAKDTTCQECMDGFTINPASSRCQLCMEHCVLCQASGLGGCDECRTGFGFNATLRKCLPCGIEQCLQCDGRGRCKKCVDGFGVTPRGACDRCGQNCRTCGASSACKLCDSTYVVQDGVCRSCADRCISCEIAGPGKCDKCYTGFTVDNKTNVCVHDVQGEKDLMFHASIWPRSLEV